MATAKVYVWKDTDEERPEGEKPWKVGTENGIGGMVFIHEEFNTYAEAWEWLHTHYVRETP